MAQDLRDGPEEGRSSYVLHGVGRVYPGWYSREAYTPPYVRVAQGVYMATSSPSLLAQVGCRHVHGPALTLLERDTLKGLIRSPISFQEIELYGFDRFDRF